MAAPPLPVLDRAPAGPRRASTLRHVPALDGLRGIAVVAVVAFHFGYLRGGYLGVDLFFVLSGYLITSLLVVEVAGTRRVALARFWGRRARRLLPALLALLVGVAAWAAWWARPVDRPVLRGDGLATLGYVANWHTIWRGVSYWDQALAPSLLAHTWSLAIEEQCYLVWPIAVAVLARGRGPAAARWLVGALAAVGAVASAGAFVALRWWGASTTRLYEGTDTRVFALCLGAVVACWLVPRPRRSGRTRRAQVVLLAVAPSALLALVVLWAVLGGTSPWLYRGGLHLASLLGALVVAGVVLDRPGRLDLTRLLALPALRLLGRLSYGIYLWHWPVAVVVDEARTGLHGLALLGARVLLTLLLAGVSFVWIEEPIRHGGALPGRRGVRAAVAASAVVAVLLVVATRDGATVVVASAPARPTASPAAPGRAGDRTVLVVGDSVAASVAAYPAADPASFPVRVANGAWIGCSILQDGRRVRGDAGDVSRPPGCRQHWPEALRSARPDVVLVLFGGPPTAAIEIGARFRHACDAPYRRLLAERLGAATVDLATTGAAVVLATGAHSTSPFRVPATNRSVGCANAVVRAVARERHVGLVDLDAHLCPRGRCRTRDRGGEIRPDDLHFGGPGGAPTVRWLLASAVEVARAGS